MPGTISCLASVIVQSATCPWMLGFKQYAGQVAAGTPLGAGNLLSSHNNGFVCGAHHNDVVCGIGGRQVGLQPGDLAIDVGQVQLHSTYP